MSTRFLGVNLPSRPREFHKARCASYIPWLERTKAPRNRVWSQASPAPENSSVVANNDTNVVVGMRPLVVNAKGALRQRPNGLQSLQNAYDSAALSSSGYKNAMPYERERILNEALPKIQKAPSLYESESERKPDLENLPEVNSDRYALQQARI